MEVEVAVAIEVGVSTNFIPGEDTKYIDNGYKGDIIGVGVGGLGVGLGVGSKHYSMLSSIQESDMTDISDMSEMNDMTEPMNLNPLSTYGENETPMVFSNCSGLDNIYRGRRGSM